MILHVLSWNPDFHGVRAFWEARLLAVTKEARLHRLLSRFEADVVFFFWLSQSPATSLAQITASRTKKRKTRAPLRIAARAAAPRSRTA